MQRHRRICLQNNSQLYPYTTLIYRMIVIYENFMFSLMYFSNPVLHFGKKTLPKKTPYGAYFFN